MAVNKSLRRAFTDRGELLTSGELDLDNPAHQHYFGDDKSLLDREKEIEISNAKADASIAAAEEWERKHGRYMGETGF